MSIIPLSGTGNEYQPEAWHLHIQGKETGYDLVLRSVSPPGYVRRQDAAAGGESKPVILTAAI